jgi:CheY-like chemotaxis protein
VNSIHILLVEDEAPKRTHIERFLKSLSSEITITIAQSVNSALDALEKQLPDLLLLDMSLPTFDVGERESGGRPQGFGGIEILRYMEMAETNCPTIVITGYEAFLREAGKPVELSQLRTEWEEEFPQCLKGVLHYNSTYDEWKTGLGKALAEFSIQAETGK